MATIRRCFAQEKPRWHRERKSATRPGEAALYPPARHRLFRTFVIRIPLDIRTSVFDIQRRILDSAADCLSRELAQLRMLSRGADFREDAMGQGEVQQFRQRIHAELAHDRGPAHLHRALAEE